MSVFPRVSKIPTLTYNLRDTDVVMWIILILLNEADTNYIY